MTEDSPEASQVVQFTVEVTHGKYKHRGRFIAGKADDHAVRGASTFDLDPLATTGPVASVRALCHNTFVARNFAQPLTRQIRVRRLQDQLQAWMQVVEDVFQPMSPLDESQLHEVCAGTLEHVEDQQNRRALRCTLRTAPRSHSQAPLKSTEVCAPFLIGHDDLTVDCGRALAGLGQFREPVSNVLTLPTRQSDQAIA
jgi:hypothetical protein